MRNTNYQHCLNCLTYTLLLVVITKIFLGEPDELFAKPSYQNGYSDCPPQSNNIWVRIQHPNTPRVEVGGDILEMPPGTVIYRQIPFDVGSVTYQESINGQIVSIEYQNYIKGVLTGEINEAEPIAGGNDWQPEMLKAIAVAIRSKAYDRCGQVIQDGVHRGINGQLTQEYRYAPFIPGTIYNVSPQTQQNFQNAINNTQDVYLQYQLNTFDVQYRDRTGLWTADNPLPHKRVYDPVGVPFEPLQRSGLAQINSNYWALGDSQDTPFPTWQYPQILAHYYTDIRIVAGNNQPLTPAYRWNFLTVNWGSGSLTPPQMVQGKIYNVQLELNKKNDKRGKG